MKANLNLLGELLGGRAEFCDFVLDLLVELLFALLMLFLVLLVQLLEGRNIR